MRLYVPVYLFAAELDLEVFERLLYEVNKRIMRLYVPVTAELDLEVFGRLLCKINKRILRLYVPVYLFTCLPRNSIWKFLNDSCVR